jgi:phospholipid/cholesterol/gamma-HCH transport system substrate-binding protein
MSTPTNHWKLGLFVILGIAASVGAIIFFGGRSLKKETVAYKTYFDESVQGLEVGSPVKFRGVSIGSVSVIDLAGDKRHVEVTYELGVKVLNSLGLAADKFKGNETKLVIPDDLRVQLASAGITGVKFLQLDFFDVKAHPPIELPFEVPENYIPAEASMMKNLEDSVVQAVDRFPELARQLLVALTQVTGIFGEIEKMGLPAKVGETLALINTVLNQISGAIVAIDPGALSKDAQQTLANLNVALTSINQVVGRVNGDKGLVASVQRTSESLGSMAQKANHVGPAMEDALKDVQSAAQSIQRFADALEMDPDMLIKGRAKRVAK